MLGIWTFVRSYVLKGPLLIQNCKRMLSADTSVENMLKHENHRIGDCLTY